MIAWCALVALIWILHRPVPVPDRPPPLSALWRRLFPPRTKKGGEGAETTADGRPKTLARAAPKPIR